MKGRIITAKEINDITQQSPPREKAIFTIMRQSGLHLKTIKKLKVKDMERILDPNPPIPSKINIPHKKYPTFIGEEAVKHTTRYLKTRKDPPLESPLFTIRNDPHKEIDTKSESRTFTTIAKKINKSTKLTLNSLKHFYKENAKEYLTELKRYNTAKDIELCRDLYEEKAMPRLQIENLTENKINQLQNFQRRTICLVTQPNKEDSPQGWQEEPPPETSEEREKMQKNPLDPNMFEPPSLEQQVAELQFHREDQNKEIANLKNEIKTIKYNITKLTSKARSKPKSFPEKRQENKA